ncbi:homolog of bacterial PANC, ARABIDOPSIS THALIANA PANTOTHENATE SYNTHETASE, PANTOTHENATE SYNTHETASE [Hibiscus trionum]|uniref:Homolog of bacterial PANC, ARABIDOPSIS THALIANA PANTOTHENATE SYNTHETASE, PANTOTHENATE SYNTHETASE n=1 Tax=Hibiscus trionum TaxID=183268 RepID=A0A9W7LQQ7_HIBTR|nr:homolog of bacterial PANC, ARABIDOPSIS THALIANA PANTOTHENATE SYNTHETASE, PANTOTHENATE SYNTHETASE [Hibiscus trionum]
MAAKDPLVITGKDEMRKWSRQMRSQGKTIGTFHHTPLISMLICSVPGGVDSVFCPKNIVDQESLEAVEEIKSPVVFCIAAWFGKVRLIDNMEINI